MPSEPQGVRVVYIFYRSLSFLGPLAGAWLTCIRWEPLFPSFLDTCYPAAVDRGPHMSTAPRKIGILLLAVCLSFTRSMLPCIWRHPRWQRGGLSYFQGTRALTRFSLPRRNRVTCIRRDRHPQVFQTPDTRSIPSFSSSTTPLLLILYSLYLILYDLNVY